ncbi:MAG: geranyl transferase, partial [Clostridia bacterium]|nr:geranyl transferase [Clostridia bacterium]
QSAEALGKSVGSDQKDGKTTFMRFYDVDGARAYAKQLTEDAVSAIGTLENSQSLVTLAEFLAKRNY